MTKDHSAGWEAISDEFMVIRSQVGARLVAEWAKTHLPASAAILDIGCGSGVPISKVLVDNGFSVWGVDASPSMISAYRRNLPDMPAVCEAVQDSPFFNRTFIGVVSIGLVFLLDEGDQRKVLTKVANVLEPGGRFLFSAPREVCRWNDRLTGGPSISLGLDAYAAHLSNEGLQLGDCRTDEGGNNYYEAVKPI